MNIVDVAAACSSFTRSHLFTPLTYSPGPTSAMFKISKIFSLTIPDITFYHGNEEWVLKGIAVDFQRSFDSLNLTTSRLESFTKARPASKYHFFVQQGQLLHHCNALGEDALNSTICLFTHLDIANFRKKQLNDCKLLVFMSSLQFSNAVSNGINPRNVLFHLTV